MGLNRDQSVKHIVDDESWDVIVVGGGATGLGVALDSATRGYKTLLLEQSDFAKATSSRSTKLIHGGVRYLAKGNFALVYEALRERWRLVRNAPHVVKKLQFIIPCYSIINLIKYYVGSVIYDWLSGRYSLGPTAHRSREQVLEALPGVRKEGLIGGVRYFDAQFDDARLAIDLAQSCHDHDGVLINYIKVTGLLKEGDRIAGVQTTDEESGKSYSIRSKVVVNATGIFVDDLLQMDDPKARPSVSPSQGIHVVLDRKFLEGNDALLIPQTSDGRVLFVVPWLNHLLVGTTDTPLRQHELEPVALDREIDFVLETAGRYLSRPPQREDIMSVFAGMRPLAMPGKEAGNTKEISRGHKISVSSSGLVTITGGKWTTYRRMAESAVNRAARVGGLQPRPCLTSSLKIHGHSDSQPPSQWASYGSDAKAMAELASNDPSLAQRLDPEQPATAAEIVWAVRNEMARTVEDVLARRLRVLFFDWRAAVKLAPKVATIMAKELNYAADWINKQVDAFTRLAQNYAPRQKL